MALTGLVPRTLVLLGVGTILLLGAATVFMYRSGLAQGRAEILIDFEQRAHQRTLREAAIFQRLESQAQHLKRIVEARWAAPERPADPPPVDQGGSRRRLPESAGPPIATFISARAGDADDLAAVAVVERVVAELGPAWGDGLSALSIAVPGRWLVGYGQSQVDLVQDFLPEDPILFESSAGFRRSAGDIIWQNALFEPGSGTWSVAAEIPLTTGAGRTARIRQELTLGDLLEHAEVGALSGLELLVLDDQDRVLAQSAHDLATPALSIETVVQALRHGESAAGESISLAGASAAGQTRLINTPHLEWWLAASELPGPGWRLIAALPRSRVDAQARHRAAGVMAVGLALIALQLIIAALILHRRVARPLRVLADAAGRLARGERGLPLTSKRRDEIGELARAFERMDRAIAASESHLRTAVDVVREREGFARALVASAADAVVVIEEGCIVEMNPRAQALFAREAVHAHLCDLAPAVQDDGRHSRDALDQACRDAAQYGPQYLPWLVQRPDGSEVDTDVGLARLELPGRVRHLLVLRDMTERNRLEEQLRHAQRLEAVGQLAGGVAHDFNNVLTAIIGSAELMRGKDPTPERKELLLRTIIGAAERAAGLTATLLDFSRTKPKVTLPVDMHGIIQDTVALLERSIDKRIRLSTDLGAAKSRVIGDASQLQNTLLNLGLNARDAMPNGGDLHFSSRIRTIDAAARTSIRGDIPLGAYLEIAIADNGSGIPGEYLERIFDPFFTTKQVGKGTGLGLATAYRTVMEHSGGVQVDTAIGVGTTFRLYFPLTEQVTETFGSGPHALANSGVILVVDDEADVRGVAVAHLQSLGFTVLEASDGAAAVAKYIGETGRIDVVVLDMEMPGMRGSDCLRALQEIDPHVAAILCSGFARDEDDSWREAGFVAAVAKPYRIRDLHRAIERALARRAAGPNVTETPGADYVI